MPASFAASIKFIPFGAAISLPSMVSLSRFSGMSVLLRSVAARARLLKLAAVFGDEGFHGPGGGFTERADRFAVDVVGHVPEQIHVLGAAMAVLDAVEHLLHPQCAFTARRALTAGLVRVKLRDVQRALDD